MSEFLAGISKKRVVSGYRELVGDFNRFIELSRDVADEAESWREYDVGNVGCSLMPNSSGIVTVEGANFRIRDIKESNDDPDTEEMLLLESGITADQAPPVCAEMATSILSADEEHSFIAMLIAASTLGNSVQDITGVRTATLPPCKDCTTILDKSPRTGQATLYISVGLETDELQIRNMRTLKKLHTLKIPDNTPVVIPKIKLANKALDIFDQSIEAHSFQRQQYPSRVVSSLTRTAIVNAAEELELIKTA